MSIELVHVYRGSFIESIHRGDIVGLDANGAVLFQYGNPYKRTFWRSSAKPFQIIPLVESGGMEAFDLSTKELALMTASHGGEEEHLRILASILNKIGKTVDDLDCGVARPMFEGEYKRLLVENIPFTQGNNPCSGKHSGMLALGVHKSIDLHDYIMVNHPIQQIMLKCIAEMTELETDQIDVAIDGCGVPVFGMPIYNMALAYTKLSGPFDLESRRGQALGMISHAMTHEPYYVAGTKRLDTILMEETKGKVLAKLGAESVYCMSIISKGVGIAMKMEDGAYRALDSVVPNLLLKHGYIDDAEYKAINERLPLSVYNHREQVVGALRCVL